MLFQLFSTQKEGIFGSLSSFLCGHVHFMADLKANIILILLLLLTFLALELLEIQSCRCQFTKKSTRWHETIFGFLYSESCNWMPQSSPRMTWKPTTPSRWKSIEEFMWSFKKEKLQLIWRSNWWWSKSFFFPGSFFSYCFLFLEWAKNLEFPGVSTTHPQTNPFEVPLRQIETSYFSCRKQIFYVKS